MNKDPAHILTINGGSSSIKFALYKSDEILTRLLHGEIDRIGFEDSTLTYHIEKENKKDTVKVEATDHQAAVHNGKSMDASMGFTPAGGSNERYPGR